MVKIVPKAVNFIRGDPEFEARGFDEFEYY